MKLALLAFSTLLFFGYSALAQKLSTEWEKPPPKHDLNSFCPPEGSPDSRDKELNKAKNRVDIPSFYHAVSFDEVKKLHVGDAGAERPRNTHSEEVRKEIAQYEGTPVRLTGYIKFGRNDEHPDPKWVGVEIEGEESCNCGSKEKDQVDFHIWLVKKPGDPYKDAVVVEMAPRIRVNNPHWTRQELKIYAEKKVPVRVFGWLMFDGEHKEQMYDPLRPDRKRIRRATLWEVHPVTRFEVKIGSPLLFMVQKDRLSRICRSSESASPPIFTSFFAN